MQPSAARDSWSELLDLVGKQKDQRAFRQLFSHFAPKLKYYALCNGLASHGDELVQEVMVTVWRKAETFDWQIASASTWIFTIARNLRVDFIRKMARTPTDGALDAEVLLGVPGEDEPVANVQRIIAERQVRELLPTLPIDQREVLGKVYMEGKSHQEVADELKLPLGTVKSRIRLALTRLRVQLEQS